MTTPQLLPLQTRVAHFDGGPSTHGMGTIVAYNQTNPLSLYTKEHLAEAAEIAAKGGMMESLVNSAYDGTRCPYVVHWDPCAKYPKGYKDVYERDSLTVIPLAQTQTKEPELCPFCSSVLVLEDDYPSLTYPCCSLCTGV